MRPDVVVMIEAALWVGAAAFLGFLGDGRNDLISIVLHDPRVARFYLKIGYTSLAANAALFCYAQMQSRQTKPQPEAASSQVLDQAVAAGGSISLLAALASFTAGIWPVFGFLAPVLVLVISFGMLMSLHFVPDIGFLAVYPPLDSCCQAADVHGQAPSKSAAVSTGPAAPQSLN